MTFKEAAERIAKHNAIHQRKEYPFAIKITEALDMATKLLLWADGKPAYLFEDDLIGIINEYYNNGLRDGFNRAKKIYDNAGRGYVKATGKCPMCEDCPDDCPMEGA